MKIAYFNYEWDPQASTGAGTHIAQLATALEWLGHRVSVFHQHRRPASGTNGHGNGKPSPWLWEAGNYARCLRDVARETGILRRERPDVVLARHALRFSCLLAARRAGLPVVLEVNAPIPYEIRRYRPGLRLLPGFSDWVERRMLHAADGAFVVSSALRDYFLQRGAGGDRITVIPNGADASKFRPEAADPQVRARFPGETLIGFSGSFARFHGIDVLEYSIARLAARQPGTRFVLLGDGPAAQDLRDRCRRGGYHSQVTCLGRVPHDRVPGILAAMDILAAPYPAQEFFYFSPIKLFEYMACGRAVVAARLGQMAEVIEHERNGLLYDAASPDDFVEKLLALARDPVKRACLGARARQTVQDHYTWEHNARRVSVVLEQARTRAANGTR